MTAVDYAMLAAALVVACVAVLGATELAVDFAWQAAQASLADTTAPELRP